MIAGYLSDRNVKTACRACLPICVMLMSVVVGRSQNRVDVQVFKDVSYQRETLKPKDMERLKTQANLKAIEQGCGVNLPVGPLDNIIDNAIKYRLSYNDVVRFFHPEKNVSLQPVREPVIVPDPVNAKRWAANLKAEVRCITGQRPSATYTFRSKTTDLSEEEREEAIFKARLMAAGKAMKRDFKESIVLNKKLYKTSSGVIDYVKKQYSRDLSFTESDAPKIVRSPLNPKKWKAFCFDRFTDEGPMPARRRKGVGIAFEMGLLEDESYILRRNGSMTENAMRIGSGFTYSLEARFPLGDNIYIGLAPSLISGVNMHAFGNQLLNNATILGAGLSLGGLNKTVNPRFVIRYYRHRVEDASLNWLGIANGLDFFRGRLQLGLDFGVNLWIGSFATNDYELIRESGIKRIFDNSNGYVAVRLVRYFK